MSRSRPTWHSESQRRPGWRCSVSWSGKLEREPQRQLDHPCGRITPRCPHVIERIVRVRDPPEALAEDADRRLREMRRVGQAVNFGAERQRLPLVDAERLV